MAHRSLSSPWIYWPVLLLLAVSAQAQNSCVQSSPSQTQALLELFTSDGCSSCPPANARVSQLLRDKSAIPVSYHVTYWNYLGWPDPFSQPAFDARQRAYARSNGHASIYTPALFLNGQEWADWSRNSAPLRQAASQAAPVRMHVSLKPAPDRAVDVTVRLDSVTGQPSPSAQDLQLRLWLVQDGVQTKPSAGELKGVDLRHDHVVRLSQILEASNAWQREATHRFTLPNASPSTQWAVVASVQSTDLRKVLQTVDVPLCF